MYVHQILGFLLSSPLSYNIRYIDFTSQYLIISFTT